MCRLGRHKLVDRRIDVSDGRITASCARCGSEIVELCGWKAVNKAMVC